MSKRDDLIQINEEKLKKVLERKGRGLQSVSRASLQAWGLMTLGKFKAKQLSGRPGLNKRSGTLSRNTRFMARGHDLSDLEGRFSIGGPAGKYARIHETGGTITPKKARMLAIPIPGSPAVTPAGVSKYPSPLRANLPKSHDFFLLETGGQVLLMGDRKGGDKPRPWYVLKHSVKIPKRLGFKKTINREKRQLIVGLRKDFGRTLRDG